jgi:hypothetical protein
MRRQHTVRCTVLPAVPAVEDGAPLSLADLGTSMSDVR